MAQPPEHRNRARKSDEDPGYCGRILRIKHGEANTDADDAECAQRNAMLGEHSVLHFKVGTKSLASCDSCA